MKTTKKRSESEWVTVENVNPPIVSKKLFARAGMVIQKQKGGRCMIPHEHALKGKVRCGNCRRALTHMIADDSEYFYCQNGLEIGKQSNCNVERYPVKEIEKVVWRAIRELIYLLKKTGVQVQKETEKRVQTIAAEEAELAKSIKQWKTEKLLQYELYADGSLTKEAYLKNKENLSRKIESAELRQSEILEKHGEQKELLEDAEHLNGLAKTYFGESELTYEIAQAFIENVYVYNLNRIEIVFRFEDEIRRIMQNAEEMKPQEQIGA